MKRRTIIRFEELGMDTTTKTIIAVGIFGLMIFAFAMP